MNNTQTSFGLRTNSRISARSNNTENMQDTSILENNPLFNEMKIRLDTYKNEQIKSINENIQIAHENFKKNFFTSLESLVNQISLLKDKKIRDNKVETVYKWFKLKMTFFHDISTIDTRTAKNVYEFPPSIDSDKSNYYEAGNFPTAFERDHRTEDAGIEPPKDRLKDYKTKKIAKEVKIEKPNEMNNTKKDFGFSGTYNGGFGFSKDDIDKQRLSSATNSVALRSTRYTDSNTKSATQTRFFQPSNIPGVDATFDPVREIKSSYAYLRPKYDYSNLMIEKTTLIAKNKELADKRNNEEMKEFLNEFGITRAKFKEEVEKKHEIKNVIRIYESKLNTEANEKNENDNKNTMSKTSKAFNKILEDKDDKIVIEDTFVDYINPGEKFQKVIINNIKNLNNKSNANANAIEIKINIKVKEGTIQNKSELITDLKNKVEKMPTDNVINAKAIDHIFDARHTYSTLLNVKEIDQPKDGYKYHYNPLSAYDNTNIEIYAMSPDINKEKPRPSTGFEFIKRSYNNTEKDDFLSQRRTLGDFKMTQISKLRDTLVKKNSNFTYSSLNEAFLNPMEDTKYPKFFLPMPGFGILSRPFEEPKKKKNRAKSTMRR